MPHVSLSRVLSKLKIKLVKNLKQTSQMIFSVSMGIFSNPLAPLHMLMIVHTEWQITKEKHSQLAAVVPQTVRIKLS